MEIKIETASIRLLDKFSEIENQCFDQEAFTKRQLAYLLTDYNSIGLVAKTDNAVAGFIISQVEIENNTTYGHIITINVVPSCRRKGVGTQMLKEMEKILKGKRHKRMPLGSSRRQPRSIETILNQRLSESRRFRKILRQQTRVIFEKNSLGSVLQA